MEFNKNIIELIEKRETNIFVLDDGYKIVLCRNNLPYGNKEPFVIKIYGENFNTLYYLKSDTLPHIKEKILLFINKIYELKNQTFNSDE